MINTKKDFFVANLSGGKDSSCMVLKLLEEKYPVDLILFCDTQLEFFEMYNHLDKFEQYIKRYTDIGRNTSSKKLCVQREIRHNA